jgi:amidase
LIAVDSQDAVTLRSIGKTTGDFLPYLESNGLKGKVIGIDKSMLYEQQGLGELMQQAIRDMQLQGAIIVEVDFIAKYHSLLKAESEVLKYEFKDGVNRYLANAEGAVRSLEEVIQFNNDHFAEVMPFFQQDLMIAAQGKGDLQSPEYIEAKNQIATMSIFLEAILEMHNLDAFAGIGSGAYSPPAIAGWPSITLPVGHSNDVPIGITFFTKPYHEKELLAMAYSYEQATKHYKKPMFLPAIKSS